MRRTLLLALALTGCASTASVMGERPTDVVHSARSAEDVVFCLQNKTGAGPAELNGSKVILHKGVYGGLIASYSVRPEGPGSVTEIRRGSSLAAPTWKSCF